MAFVIGGFVDDDDEDVDDGSAKSLNSMERYDTASGQWVTAAAMGTTRDYFGACLMAGELYVTGGSSGTGVGDDTELMSAEKYTPSTDSWSTIAPLPDTGTRHAAVAVGGWGGRAAMYVLGGLNDDAIIASTLKYDSDHNTWSEVTPMPKAIFGFGACAVGNDIYAFGGHDNV
jgi:N-acetylneuraminic acid mutarotase